jgi:peroxiredoxin
MKPTIDKHELGFTLLSDAKLEATEGFGLAFRMPDEGVERYKGFGIDLEDASGETHHVLPVPAVYLIGPDGKVLFSYVNPDYKVRLEPSILLAAAQALE